ncbi:MAG: hypothetical protein OXI41_06390 [Chloroflexota bacterium]|nr:hypothetical protein [Chloroflexota bacterium]MDE2895550.1 hypothetical protein [Chloroflexota bacterium]
MAPLDRTRLTGLILMVAAAFQALWFLLGVRRQSYAAVAIPAAAITLSAAVLLFWIGWTTYELEDDLEGLNFVPEPLDDI